MDGNAQKLQELENLVTRWRTERGGTFITEVDAAIEERKSGNQATEPYDAIFLVIHLANKLASWSKREGPFCYCTTSGVLEEFIETIGTEFFIQNPELISLFEKNKTIFGQASTQIVRMLTTNPEGVRMIASTPELAHKLTTGGHLGSSSILLPALLATPEGRICILKSPKIIGHIIQWGNHGVKADFAKLLASGADRLEQQLWAERVESTTHGFNPYL